MNWKTSGNQLVRYITCKIGWADYGGEMSTCKIGTVDGGKGWQHSNLSERVE